MRARVLLFLLWMKFKLLRIYVLYVTAILETFVLLLSFVETVTCTVLNYNLSELKEGKIPLLRRF